MRVFRPRRDNLADVLATVFPPVPHEKRMRAVVGVAAAVHLHVTRVVRKLLFILIAQHERVPRLRQQAIEELDIARVKFVIKLVVARMMNDQHAAFLQQRLVAIEVEVITEAHHLNEQRVEDGIDVVGRNVRDAGDQNVTLASYRNRILVKRLLNNLLVHRLGLAGMTGNHFVLRRLGMKQLATRRTR